jgi:RecA-family ATPase
MSRSYSLEQLVDGLGLTLDSSQVPAPAQTTHAINGQIPEGHRNDTLSRLAFSMRKRGFGIDAIEQALLGANEACGLPDDEVRAIARGKRKIDFDAFPAETKKVKGYAFPPEAGRVDLSRRPKRRDSVIEGFMPAGKVGITGGAGGTFKTALAIEEGICVAVGRAFMGLAVNEPGSVILALGEEDRDEIDRRIGAAVALMQLTEEERALVGSRLLAFPCIGEDIRLTTLRSGTITSTGLAEVIIERARELAERTGVRVRLIVLDHMMLISGGEVNSNEHAAAVLQEAARIAVKTSAAVNILAHSPKSSSAKEEPDQNDILGAVASVNLARWAVIVRRMRAGEATALGIEEAQRHRYARVAVVKSNSTPMGLEFNVRADYDSEFEAVALTRVDLKKAKLGPSEKAMRVLAVLEELEGADRVPVAMKDWERRVEKDGFAKRSSFYGHARELREAGLVEKDNADRYTTIGLA